MFGNGLKANVTSDGRLINVLGSPVANPSLASTSPSVSASVAIAAARSDAEESVPPVRVVPGKSTKTIVFSNGDQASPVAFQGVDGLRLAWQTIVSGGSAAYQHVVDGATGRILYRRSLVNYSDGIVLDNYPGAPAGGVATQRSISLPGWLSSSTNLSGNNTHVYSDIDDSNDPTNLDGFDEEIHPSGGTNWLYPLQPFNDPPLDTLYGCSASLPCTWDPRIGVFPNLTFDGSFSYEQNQNQDGTQLFYFINKYHDHLAASPIGFTEAAGNFQVTNSSGQGLGGDPVLGEALDGANTLRGSATRIRLHTDNANFATPPDGQSPRMQMYSGTTRRPTSSRARRRSVLAGERRRRGGHRLPRVHPRPLEPARRRRARQLDARQHPGRLDGRGVERLVRDGLPRQPGLLHATPPAAGELRVGHYVGAGPDLIRTEPMDCPVGSNVAELPGRPPAPDTGGYTYGDFGKIIGRPEVHADGEIWGQTLLGSPRRARLAHGRSGSSRGRWSSRPSNPSFLDMRNAILQADIVVVGGSHLDTIWSVFAHRGMGYFAGGDRRRRHTAGRGLHAAARRAQREGQTAWPGHRRRHEPADRRSVVAFGGHDSRLPRRLRRRDQQCGAVRHPADLRRHVSEGECHGSRLRPSPSRRSR